MCKNQRHLLPVNVPKPDDMPIEPDCTYMMQPTYDEPEDQREPHDEPALHEAVENNLQNDRPHTVTRSGRIYRMPRRYNDFDMSRR